MNISISKIVLMIAGIILLSAGVAFGIRAIEAKDWIQGIFSLAGIAVGFALIVGKGITLSP